MTRSGNIIFRYRPGSLTRSLKRTSSIRQYTNIPRFQSAAAIASKTNIHTVSSPTQSFAPSLFFSWLELTTAKDGRVVSRAIESILDARNAESGLWRWGGRGDRRRRPGVGEGRRLLVCDAPHRRPHNTPRSCAKRRYTGRGRRTVLWIYVCIYTTEKREGGRESEKKPRRGGRVNGLGGPENSRERLLLVIWNIQSRADITWGFPRALPRSDT